MSISNKDPVNDDVGETTDGENGNGKRNEKVQFMRRDGVEKNGYICFKLDEPQSEDGGTTVTEGGEITDTGEGVQEADLTNVKTNLQTCPEDPRFQQTNKTTWCWRMFVDYHRCRNLLGEGATQCDYFYRCYHSICPNNWHERWTEQLQDGTFPYDVSRDRQVKSTPCP